MSAVKLFLHQKYGSNCWSCFCSKSEYTHTSILYIRCPNHTPTHKLPNPVSSFFYPLDQDSYSTLTRSTARQQLQCPDKWGICLFPHIIKWRRPVQYSRYSKFSCLVFIYFVCTHSGKYSFSNLSPLLSMAQ